MLVQDMLAETHILYSLFPKTYYDDGNIKRLIAHYQLATGYEKYLHDYYWYMKYDGLVLHFVHILSIYMNPLEVSLFFFLPIEDLYIQKIHPYLLVNNINIKSYILIRGFRFSVTSLNANYQEKEQQCVLLG